MQKLRQAEPRVRAARCALERLAEAGCKERVDKGSRRMVPRLPDVAGMELNRVREGTQEAATRRDPGRRWAVAPAAMPRAHTAGLRVTVVTRRAVVVRRWEAMRQDLVDGLRTLIPRFTGRSRYRDSMFVT